MVVAWVLLDFEENNRFEGIITRCTREIWRLVVYLFGLNVYIKAVTQHNQIRKSSFITHKLVSGHGKHANSHNFI